MRVCNCCIKNRCTPALSDLCLAWAWTPSYSYKSYSVTDHATLYKTECAAAVLYINRTKYVQSIPVICRAENVDQIFIDETRYGHFETWPLKWEITSVEETWTVHSFILCLLYATFDAKSNYLSSF